MEEKRRGVHETQHGESAYVDNESPEPVSTECR